MWNFAPPYVPEPIAITTSGASYIATDVVGGIITIPLVNLNSSRRVVLKSIQVNDKGGVAPSLNIYFFKSTPTGGTYTDNSPLVWGTGDSALKVGQVSVLNANYLTDISQSSLNLSGLTMKMDVTGTSLFMLIVSQSTYTITNGNLSLNLAFDQE